MGAGRRASRRAPMTAESRSASWQHATRESINLRPWRLCMAEGGLETTTALGPFGPLRNHTALQSIPQTPHHSPPERSSTESEKRPATSIPSDGQSIRAGCGCGGGALDGVPWGQGRMSTHHRPSLPRPQQGHDYRHAPSSKESARPPPAADVSSAGILPRAGSKQAKTDKEGNESIRVSGAGRGHGGRLGCGGARGGGRPLPSPVPVHRAGLVQQRPPPPRRGPAQRRFRQQRHGLDCAVPDACADTRQRRQVLAHSHALRHRSTR